MFEERETEYCLTAECWKLPFVAEGFEVFNREVTVIAVIIVNSTLNYGKVIALLRQKLHMW